MNLWIVSQFKGEYNPIHYHEGDLSGVGYLKLPKGMTKNKMVKNKKIIYDLDIDQKDYKWSGTKILNKVPLSAMPDYLSENYKKYVNWLEI